MKRLKTTKRKIHRKITAISAIPLLITIGSGTIYSILQTFGLDAFWLIKWGVDAFWLIKWHTGNFSIINLQPFYSIFLGIASIIYFLV